MVSNIGQLAKETAKGLGPGAYLVNLLPSTVFVITVFALIASRVYPGQSQFRDSQDRPIDAGVDSLAFVVKNLGVVGGVLLILAVLATAIMIRPFQVSAVQFLEGYSTNRGRGIAEALAVEHHLRRHSFYLSRQDVTAERAASRTLTEVVAFSKEDRRARRMQSRAKRIVESYPHSARDFLPTALGNALRRAESTAGERYGLDTVIVYPRLYPYISNRLDAEISNQLDVLDATATFVFVFSLQAAVATPLIVRWDWWSLAPVTFALLAAISYQGARYAADRYAVVLAAAFDLHRFDMLDAMHRKLPETAHEELAENTALSEFLGRIDPLPPDQGRNWKYAHPESTAIPAIKGPDAGAPPVGDGDEGDDKDRGSDSAKDSGATSDADLSAETSHMDDKNA
jgi:hypothetical protein